MKPMPKKVMPVMKKAKKKKVIGRSEIGEMVQKHFSK